MTASSPACVTAARSDPGVYRCGVDAARREIPRIVSVDDHVIEPPHVWQDRLPARMREQGPRVVRDSYSVEWVDGQQRFRKGGDGPETDWWVYEDLTWSHQMLNACAGYEPEE